MNYPVIDSGQYGAGRNRYWKRVFEDKFHGDKLDLGKWAPDLMKDPLNRAGNAGIKRDGTPHSKSRGSVNGKRWAAWYDDFIDQTAMVDRTGLRMRAHIVKASDLTRRAFKHLGVEYHPERWRIYLAYLNSATRIYSNEENQHVIDKSRPSFVTKYGCIEAEVTFGQNTGPGCRGSIWGTPMHDDDGKDMTGEMYTDNPDALELDIFEHEGGRFQGDLMLKNLSGDYKGDTPDGQVNIFKQGINLMDGKRHVVTHIWEPDGHYWLVDGREMQRDLERVMQVYAQFSITREANTGAMLPLEIKDKGRLVAVPPYLPRDPGLYLTNVFANLEAVRRSELIVHRLTVWHDNPSLRKLAMAKTADKEPEPMSPVSPRKLAVVSKNTLTWEGNPGESKWNVYLNGKYVATVSEPKYDATASGEYSVEGISDRSDSVRVG